MQIEPLGAGFGARVTGVRVADLDERAFAEVYELWLRYAVLVFPD